MKNRLKVIIGICMLLSITGISQSRVEKDRLKAQAERFISLYNTGDTLQYRAFLQKLPRQKEPLERMLQGYRNTYNMLGEVDAKDFIYVSLSEVDVLLKEEKFDTWWKFMITTDENQHFFIPARTSTAFARNWPKR